MSLIDIQRIQSDVSRIINGGCEVNAYLKYNGCIEVKINWKSRGHNLEFIHFISESESQSSAININHRVMFAFDAAIEKHNRDNNHHETVSK